MLNKLQWTPELSRRFWSELAGSDFIESLSFANLSGPNLLEFIKPFLRPQGSHLDFGAGDGYLVGSLLRDGYATAAFEPSARADLLTAHFGEHPLYLGTLTGDADKKFDVVIFSEVIEHLFDEDFPMVFNAIQRMLAEDGTLIVTTPNSENLEKSSVYCPTCKHLFHPWQHVRRFTEQTLTELLAKFGFACQRVHQYDCCEAPARMLENQESAQFAKEVYDTVEHVLSKPFGKRDLPNILRKLLEDQTQRRTSFPELVTKSKVNLGGCTRLIFVGHKAAASVLAGPVSAPEPESDLTAEFATCRMIHDQIIRNYQQFSNGHQEFFNGYWCELDKAIQTPLASRQEKNLLFHFQNKIQSLHQTGAKLQKLLAQFDQNLEKVPIRKHEFLLPMYNQSLKNYASFANPSSDDALYRLIGDGLSKNLQGNPALQNLHKQIIEQDRPLWNNIFQIFENHLETLRTLLQMPPFHSIAGAFRHKEEIDKRETQLSQNEKTFNKLWMVKLVRKLGLLKSA